MLTSMLYNVYMSELGTYLKMMRKERKLSLGAVAKDVGCCRTYIEEGRKEPNPLVLRALAEFYQVIPGELFVKAGYLPGPLSEEKEERLRHLSRLFSATFLECLDGLNADGRAECTEYLEYLYSKERYRKSVPEGQEVSTGVAGVNVGGGVFMGR